MATVDFKEFSENLLLPNGKDVSLIKVMLLYDERAALIRRVERYEKALKEIYVESTRRHTDECGYTAYAALKEESDSGS